MQPKLVSEVIACNMGVFTDTERAQHAEVVKTLFARAEDVQLLANGVAYRLPAESVILMLSAEFLAQERRCCPFLHFELSLDAAGPLWLRLTGPEGTAEFLRQELQFAQRKERQRGEEGQ